MSNKKIKLDTIIQLKEKVNFDVLARLLSAEGIDSDLRKQLKGYYHRKKEDHVPVNYHYSATLKNKGRLYAENSLSLQNFKKEIRHALAKEYYYDIDMENCHPVLIAQYCKKHDIECEKLDEYVKNRDHFLGEIMSQHEIVRDEAKKLMLRICYLGNYVITKDGEEIEPTKKVRFVKEFQEEMRDIADQICDTEKEIYESVRKSEDKKNIKSSVLSITAQVCEHKCLMAMVDFFKNKGYTPGVLCFDGLMVEKSEKLKKNMKKILEECQDYVKSKTKYEIKLARKPMDLDLSFVLPQFSEFVESDRDCQEKIFKIEGRDKFKFCFDKLYVFNEKTGMYDRGSESFYYYLVKNRQYLNIVISVNEKTGKEKRDNYGDSAPLQKKVLQFVKTAAKDDEWLEKTETSSLGHLLFEDGIYDMKKDKFTKGFNPKIVFHARIPHKFPERNKEEIKQAYKISFGRLFDDPKPMIAALSTALAGELDLKRFYFCPGRSNAGKSYLVKMLKKAFGGFVRTFNAESLAHTSSMDSKDEGARNRWAYLLRHSRILMSNEINMKKELDGNAVKKHSSGGDQVTGRTHGGEEVEFIPNYKLFCMLNDIPKINPMDKAAVNRLTYIEFPYVFVDQSEKDNKPYFKPLDKNLDKKITDPAFIRGFIHILLDGYKEYLKNGLPEFDQEVKKKWTEEDKQNDIITDLIKEHYEITNLKTDFVTVADMNKFKTSHKDILGTTSAQRFNEILREDLGLTDDRKSQKRVWFCIKKKTINSD